MADVEKRDARKQSINVAVVFSQVYVCAVVLMGKEVGSALQRRERKVSYNFLGQLSLPTTLKNSHVYKPCRKFMKLRRCPVGQKSNWFFSFFRDLFQDLNIFKLDTVR